MARLTALEIKDLGARASEITDYQIVKCIGAGGVGAVFRARKSGGSGSECALKVVQSSKSSVAQLGHEVLSEVNHPNLIRMEVIPNTEGLLILEMDLADTSLAASNTTGLELVLRFMDQAASALDYLNFDKHIIHNDIKPGNLLLKGDRLFVADFDLARIHDLFDAYHDSGKSPSFAAPELFEGRSTRWSDQYSLGATYYRLRTGGPPIVGDLEQIQAAHKGPEPPLISLADVEERSIVARALRRNPRDRWLNSRQFVGALKAHTAPRPGTHNSLSMEFLPVLPMRFKMGSPPGERGRSFDETQHDVRFSRPFEMSKYPVTQRQFTEVLGRVPGKFPGDDLPIHNVTWDEAVAFCDALSRRAASRGFLYRLPTEAEWEGCCRAGQECGKFPFIFSAPCETASAHDANYDARVPYGPLGCSGLHRDKPIRVGAFFPNPWGFHDMHGNVYEWCSDWYSDSYYQTPEAKKDPTGPVNGRARVLRGGAYCSDATQIRAARRHADLPQVRKEYYGFRVVRVKRP